MGRLYTRPVMRDTYECLGRRVYVPPTADIEPGFLPGEANSRFVQEILDQIDTPWVGEQHRTISGFPELQLRVIPSRGRQIVWAKHKEHTAHHVGLSPFTYVRSEGRQTDVITVHLEMKGDTPWLVRAYAGEMRPPLPWMQSARSWYMGGIDGCRKYWRGHAYVYDRNVIVPRSERDTPVATAQRSRRGGGRRRR